MLSGLAAVTVLTWYRASRQAIRPFEAVGWTMLWGVAAVIVCLPRITTFFAELVGVGRGVDLVIYISIFVLFLLVFHVHLIHDQIEKSLTDLVRYDALRALPPTHELEPKPSSDKNELHG